MKGLTLYLDVLQTARKWASDEQFGRLCKIALDAAENETMPTFDNDSDKMMFEGFSYCLDKGFEIVNKKRNGIKERWEKEKDNKPRNIKPNKDFNKVVANYVGELDNSGNIAKNKKESDTFDDIETDKADVLRTFLNDNPQYVTNNKCFSSAKNNNPRLNNFCGENEISAQTGNYVFETMKNKLQINQQ